jgi:tetratricopeptide (TPR) repeat protein
VTAYNLAPYQGVAAFTAPTVKMIDAGAFVDAREVLKLGELIYPFSADIQFLLARTYNGLNNQADADKKALAAVSLAPAYIDPVLGKLKISSTLMPVVLSTLGWGNYYVGNFETAIKRFEESNKAGSKDPNNGRGIGFTYYRMGKHKEAVPFLEAALALEPKTLLPIPRNKPVPGFPFSYWYVEYTAGSILGWVNYRLGNAEKAEKLFAAEVSRNPFSLDALTGLGYAKTLQKDKAGATKYFQEALKVNYTYGDALFGLEELKKL